MAIVCTCRRTSPPGVLPATCDVSACPTHGPGAPRYFVDHGTIHDRVTGKHLDHDEVCDLLVAFLNGLVPAAE